MKNRTSRKAGFTLVEIMIVVAIIGLLAAIAIPNFIKARNSAQANACINNLRQIDAAIQQWALETGKHDTDQANNAVVQPYLKGNSFPSCPAGGNYAIAATVATVPSVTCSLGNSVSPFHYLP